MNDLLTRRKDHHIDIVLGEAVASHGPAMGFGRYTIEFDALPEIDLADVDLSCTVLGRRLTAPVVIGAMTGGTDRTGAINRVLAEAAARVGVGMALGSQRPMLRFPEVAESFAVREHAPGLPLLIGNVGAVQLNYGVTTAQIRDALDRVGADAVNLHLNALQEAIQPEGDTNFRGLYAKIQGVIDELGRPVLLKEVGCGLSARTAARVAGLRGLAGVEVAGTGGTSWAAVESHRAGDDAVRAVVGQRLAGFGVPTPDSVRIARAHLPHTLIVASGGLRTGMDAATAIALGADVVATARPLLEAAVHGVDAVVTALETLIYELRVICFCAGASNLAELRRARLIDTTQPWPVTAPA